MTLPDSAEGYIHRIGTLTLIVQYYYLYLTVCYVINMIPDSAEGKIGTINRIGTVLLTTLRSVVISSDLLCYTE